MKGDNTGSDITGSENTGSDASDNTGINWDFSGQIKTCGELLFLCQTPSFPLFLFFPQMSLPITCGYLSILSQLEVIMFILPLF